MATVKETDLRVDKSDVGPARIVDFAEREAEFRAANGPRSANRLLLFICELRRRRVCRAATFYSITFWAVCQIVDVVAPALDLPEWTLKLVIVLGLILFPVVLVLSWLIDITPQGLVADVGESPVAECRSHDTRVSKILDCALLVAAVALIGVVLSTSPPAGEANEADIATRQVVVQSFQVLSVADQDVFSAGLIIELQHALRMTPDVTVVDALSPGSAEDLLRLNGVILLDDSGMHVAATLVDTRSGVVTWSTSITEPFESSLVSSADIASYVVAALPLGRHDLVMLEHTDGGG